MFFGKTVRYIDIPCTYSCSIIPRILFSKSDKFILTELFSVAVFPFFNFCIIFIFTLHIRSGYVCKKIKILLNVKEVYLINVLITLKISFTINNRKNTRGISSSNIC